MLWYTKCWAVLALTVLAALVEAAEVPSSHVHAAHVRPAPFKRWERRYPLPLSRLRAGPGGDSVLGFREEESLSGDTGQDEGEDPPTLPAVLPEASTSEDPLDSINIVPGA